MNPTIMKLSKDIDVMSEVRPTSSSPTADPRSSWTAFYPQQGLCLRLGLRRQLGDNSRSPSQQAGYSEHRPGGGRT